MNKSWQKLEKITKYWCYNKLKNVGKIYLKLAKFKKMSRKLQKVLNVWKALTKEKVLIVGKLYQKKPIGTKSEEEKNDQKQTV